MCTFLVLPKDWITMCRYGKIITKLRDSSTPQAKYAYEWMTVESIF